MEVQLRIEDPSSVRMLKSSQTCKWKSQLSVCQARGPSHQDVLTILAKSKLASSSVSLHLLLLLSPERIWNCRGKTAWRETLVNERENSLLTLLSSSQTIPLYENLSTTKMETSTLKHVCRFSYYEGQGDFFAKLKACFIFCSNQRIVCSDG